MTKLYVDANPSYLAYVLEGSGLGGSDYTKLPPGYTSVEAEYLAVIYGLNEYFDKWNKELDARQYDLDVEKTKAEGEEVFARVSTPSDRTARPLPPAVKVLSDNEVVVKQLNRQYHIKEERLRRLARQVWQMTDKVEVTFEWISRKNNLAGKMLP
jgi:ribonuclease HI